MRCYPMVISSRLLKLRRMVITGNLLIQERSRRILRSQM